MQFEINEVDGYHYISALSEEGLVFECNVGFPNFFDACELALSAEQFGLNPEVWSCVSEVTVIGPKGS